MKTYEFINFNKKDFKIVDYADHKEYLGIGSFVKFYYGPGDNPEYWHPVIGKVESILKNGICCGTPFGWMFPSYDRLFKIFLPKIKGVVKETRILSNLKGDNPNKVLGLLNGNIDRIKNIVEQKHPDVEITDENINTDLRFKREVVFKRKGKTLVLSIADKHADKIVISGSAFDRKSSVKVRKEKVNLNLMLEKLKEIL